MDEMLSQDEINALLAGMGSDDGEAGQPAEADADAVMEDRLSATTKDAIGEIANISMGSSATTLYSLVNMKVDITTPVVTMANWKTVVADYERPCVFIQIHYTSGLDGTNIMILKEHDVKVITDLMMGGDGSNTGGEISELHLSAISEAMNQMMGAAATSLSTMMGKMIDISPPEASVLDLNDLQSGGDIAPFLAGQFVKISFRMQIGDLVDSSIMQLYPVEFAESLYTTFIEKQLISTPSSEPEPYTPPQAEIPAAASQPGMGETPQGMPAGDMGMNMNGMPMQGMPMMNGMGMNMQGMPMQGMPMMNGMGMNMNGMPMQGMPMNMGMGMGMPQMNIQPAQFQNFGSDASAVPGQENIGLIRDVPLDVTVELGRTKKSISDILDFAPGTIIELDRIAGESIDVLVNGKFVAKGEVVVIEENFGVRVTEIVK
ncbi:MAG: flagellar motor switch phosphatase FliY [Clostridium sp.]|nr:flagellar motor switch phosphatase FliY [Clostridium sp.]